MGLTAAVARALTEIKVPCNMVSALRHDHVFVPEGREMEAMAAIEKLTKRS